MYAAAPLAQKLNTSPKPAHENRIASVRGQLRKRLNARTAPSNKGRANLSAQLEAINAPVSERGFAVASIVLMLAAVTMLKSLDAPTLLSICGGCLAGWGLPRAALSTALKRRTKVFRETFAPALDMIVRAAQAGMPLNRCLQIAAGDGAGQLNTQLVRLSAELTSGAPIPALHRFGEKAEIPEARFFAFTLALQQETGGNLSKALGALSAMLRGRAVFRAKVAILTAEARMSAIIICSLPVIVAAALAIASPDYLTPLWTHPVGRMCLAGAVLSVLTGAAAMRFIIKSSFGA